MLAKLACNSLSRNHEAQDILSLFVLSGIFLAVFATRATARAIRWRKRHARSRRRSPRMEKRMPTCGS